MPSEKAAALQASVERHNQVAAPFFAKYCNACHGSSYPEGDLELAQLNPNMATASAGRWAMVLEKLETGEMPPEGEPRPSDQSIAAVIDWITAEMKRSGKHLERRQVYTNPNLAPHHRLFDPRSEAPFDAPARVRRLSPHIYEAFASSAGRGARGIGQPFSPAGRSTFQDVGTPKVDEPITTQLLHNALAIVEAQTSTRIDNGQVRWTGVREFEPLLDERTPLDDAALARAVAWQFENVLRRPPSEQERSRFIALVHRNVQDAGRQAGVKYALAAVFLLPEAVFRWEVGDGEPDEQGRLRLAPREIAFALFYALTDRQPDGWLLAAADQGELDSREGVEAAVRQMLDDQRLDKPRILRFFREYFRYHEATEVFKQREDFPDHDARTLVQDTEQLIRYLLDRDQDVLRELLTTNKSFVNYRYDAGKKVGVRGRNDPIHLSYGLPPDWKWTPEQPVELPGNQRAGVLTQPAWLTAFSTSFENHPIHRGQWVRERLLGGVVPDIPITVDAQLPDDPEKTLRERLAVTEQAYCFKCHTLMNRLGLPFEMYDHFGRFRTVEWVLDREATEKNVDERGRHLGSAMRPAPVDAGGGFEHAADPQLSGDVKDAVELVQKMADSELVEQVFVRHAFRYWMGRDETLGDAASLQAAHAAYRRSGGSMKALITALLTSDSFLYRVPSDSEGSARE